MQLEQHPSSESGVPLAGVLSAQQSEKLCGNADASGHAFTDGNQPINKHAIIICLRNDTKFLILTTPFLAGKFPLVQPEPRSLHGPVLPRLRDHLRLSFSLL
jgi:hypothetical protein